MITSELITTAHRTRKALIYIRQSTPHQVLTNQESLRLQYALHQRAVELGWQAADIEIIDTDLGMTGAAAELREGFKEVVAQVTLGQVGIILSSEVTRLSRNCTDWYPLLDICGYRNCLIADRDGIYDPGSPNGRLLLGLKGQLSELELHTIRARMTAGLLNKAQRGDLALPLPVGLVHSPNQQVVKDPHLEVQNRLALVFSTFLRVKSAGKVLQFFNQHDLHLLAVITIVIWSGESQVWQPSCPFSRTRLMQVPLSMAVPEPPVIWTALPAPNRCPWSSGKSS